MGVRCIIKLVIKYLNIAQYKYIHATQLYCVYENSGRRLDPNRNVERILLEKSI